MEDTDQREGIHSLLPTSGSWESKSGCQAELVYICVHVGRCQGGQKHQVPLELQLQATVRWPIWMLGTELGFSRRALCASNS